MARINFLYWNINNLGLNIKDHFEKVLKDFEIDTIILAESSNSFDEKYYSDLGYKSVELQMNNKVHKYVQVFFKPNDNYEITHQSEFTSLEDSDGNDVEDESIQKLTRKVNRIQVFKISGKIKETYFACIHFPSKLYHDETTHLQIVPRYKSKIHDLTKNSDRLFIIGDFNMNPFDLGMIEPTGFFALNNRDLLTTDYKWKFGGKEILYYNPCWTLLGDYATTGLDTQKRSGGSYYYEDSKSRCLYWYLIDQIILRKSLISEFISDSLKIGENAELLETITQKKIKGEKKLDHFPLTISFNFNPE